MTQRSRNIVVLSAMAGIFIAFALAGRFLIDPSEMDKVNQGTLITPHIAVEELNLNTQAGQQWTGQDMSGQWSLLYIAGEACERGCKNALFYLMARLRQSLSQDADRLRLILTHTTPPSAELQTFMDEKLGPMVELRGKAATIRQALAPAFDASGADPLDYLYLAAPDGQIFMWYPTHEDKESLLEEADGIHADLKRTLKGSQL